MSETKLRKHLAGRHNEPQPEHRRLHTMRLIHREHHHPRLSSLLSWLWERGWWPS